MRLFLTIFLLLYSGLVFSQVNTNFTQFFINPYLYNPSYAGADAQGVLFLSYRNQWTGFEGAPKIANASIHTPVGKSVGMGMNFSNEQKSILNISSAQVSFSYSLAMGQNSFLRFGISGGGAFNTVDNEVFEDLSDPVFDELLDNNMYLTGNAGLSLQINTFNLGVAIPNLFTEHYVTTENFTVGEVDAMENLIISASNRFYFGQGRHIFEPALLYRYSNILPPQLEVAGIFHISHTVWIGGSYKEDFGLSAFGGIKLNQKFAFGYSYSIANSGINEVASPTHEAHISLLLGRKNEKRAAYSFVNSEKASKEKPLVAKKEEPVKEEDKKGEPHIDVEKKDEPVKAQGADSDPVIDKEMVEPEDTSEAVENETGEPVVEAPVQEKGKEENKTLSTPERADKPVVVKKGNHLLELEEGNYVIVGAFSVYDNAEKYSDQLFIKGYSTRFGFTTEKNLWYVYLFKSDEVQEARTERDKARKNSLFSNAWLLTVEK